jgi:hypothetical protein
VGDWIGGSTKRMGKLSSAFEKADSSAAYPFCGMNFIPKLGIRFRIAKVHTRWVCNFKGLSQDGDGWIFQKISAPLSLIKAFRINLITAGSILVNSTFIVYNTDTVIKYANY